MSGEDMALLPLAMLLSSNENNRGWIVLILLHVEDAPSFFFLPSAFLVALSPDSPSSSAGQEHWL